MNIGAQFLRRLARLVLMAAPAAVATAILLGGAAFPAAASQSYTLSTATAGGTYYPVGVALATLMRVKLEPTKQIGMSAISTAGSAENIQLMRDKKAEFAILQGLFGMYAMQGSGPLKADGPQPYIRSILMLWANVEHFLLAADEAKTGTMADMAGLAGKKFAIGARDSGTEYSSRFILRNLGIDPDAMDLVYQGYGPSVDALQKGEVVGVNPAAGAPVSVVIRAFAQMRDKVRGLEFTPEQAQRADGGAGLYWPHTIPVGTYPGQSREWKTIAQPNFLAVHADVPEADVYEITKAIFENTAFLNNIHAATREISLDTALTRLPAPLHPGAVRYYREKGREIPANLLAK
ncbi:TAXI family TRAP transporter solute-binding subunit [Oceanibaculum pacificum]|nr:TAXI family TRAP transporter solute-binding subunit [Oceanibaculum pacificum]